MLLKPKNILFFLLSALIACFSLTFMGKSLELQNFCCYAAVLTVSVVIVFSAGIGIPVLINKAFNVTVLSIEERKITHSRQAGLDIVRFFAIIFVPLIHFFGLSNYYAAKLDNAEIFFFTVLRNLAVCAVPLFLIITGYFKINKRVSLNHYKAVIPVLLSHIFISSVRIFVDIKYHAKYVDFNYIADRLLYFEYGWYVKLYIGMLMLIPFINAAFNSLKKRRHKEYFILTLVFLSCAGPLFFDIIPSSWLILYVFMYYLIGAYLRQYRLKINKAAILAALAAILFLSSYAQYVHSFGAEFDWSYLAYTANSGYSSFSVVISSVLFFMLFMDIKIKNKAVCSFFKAFSVVSLEMYLFSQMFDGIIYTPIQETGADFYFFADNIFIIVASVVILSFAAAKIKCLVFFVVFDFIPALTVFLFKNREIPGELVLKARCNEIFVFFGHIIDISSKTDKIINEIPADDLNNRTKPPEENSVNENVIENTVNQDFVEKKAAENINNQNSAKERIIEDTDMQSFVKEKAVENVDNQNSAKERIIEDTDMQSLVKEKTVENVDNQNSAKEMTAESIDNQSHSKESAVESTDNQNYANKNMDEHINHKEGYVKNTDSASTDKNTEHKNVKPSSSKKRKKKKKKR